MHEFANNEYHTPPDMPRDWLDRLGGNGRLFFHLRFASIIIRARRVVARGRYDLAAWTATSYAIFKLIERSGGRFHISGLDYLRTTPGPVVIVSNHMSSLENGVTICLAAPIKPLSFVIKESLIRYPIFGPVMRARDPIPVTRTNPREDFQTVLNRGAEMLQAGKSVVVYPEGTRRSLFDAQEFNSLGVKLAKKAGVPVIPLAVKTDFWGNGEHMRDFGPIDRSKPIYMAFGEAVEAVGNGRTAHQSCLDFIGGKLASWGVPTSP
ncbi:MAG: 1-acyl-sn-glycerol-3-phosphate acyltransferase [Ardenticatenaceae bacterium]|nr:1-acyl-sn-glycerol-3-phosphate acyltransferase [Anaerolineales bacterium]MCB8922473.1 1-acyl-sn-glycerol-3-phosphate acyltransferase [Ardenticatenaceae bacterium]MCB8989942.1 1-acyl-sn-glycerol-3-phosphate acyltransferase [Ardenticatenaceae bacterium]MCB9005385.1 1-acyl-sn-glycerol-3-phosphate acyltransferase [Ardenticatenaceae bacterium]